MSNDPARATVDVVGPGVRDAVALVLALGLVTALNFITIAVLWDAVESDGLGVSQNAALVLSGAFGGIIGILGSQLGYRTARASNVDAS